MLIKPHAPPLITDGLMAQRYLAEHERKDAMRGGMMTMNGMDSHFIPAGGGGWSHTVLGSIVSSCVFDLDATISDSYGGSGQTWANLETTPADGSGQTAYDFYLGANNTATTDDPTFTGSAGSQSAYWDLDGGDYFSLAGSMTTFINSLHKTTGGSDFTFILVGYIPDLGANTGYFQTGGTGSTSVGVRINLSSSEVTTLRMRGGSAAVSVTGQTLPITTPFVTTVAYKDSDTSYYYSVNTTTQSSKTFTKNTTTTDPTANCWIGRGNGTTHMPSGTRIYAASMFNAAISDTDLGNIITEYNGRHARSYA